MPEEKGGSIQKSIEAAVSSIVNAGERNGQSVNQAAVGQAADARSTAQPTPTVQLPPAFANGGKK